MRVYWWRDYGIQNQIDHCGSNWLCWLDTTSKVKEVSKYETTQCVPKLSKGAYLEIGCYVLLCQQLWAIEKCRGVVSVGYVGSIEPTDFLNA